MTKTPNTLLVYPTARALHMVSSSFKNTDQLLPTLMRMDEFENHAILVGFKSQVDPTERILILRQAASFDAFSKLKLNLDLARFFTRSDAVFKFFEELASEQVEFGKLQNADAYSEFGEHLEILQTLQDRYEDLLNERGLTDKAFLPKSYKINDGFIKSYESIEIHIEGYLSRFEFELLGKVASKTKLFLHYTTSKFTAKIEERFKEYGLELSKDAHLLIDFSSKRIVSQVSSKNDINAKVIATQERYEQISLAFVAIEEMVSSGIKPEKIALILPDESFKDSFALYDRYHNLNFAMGYDYSQEKTYKNLEAIKLYWQTLENKDRDRLERYGVKLEILEEINSSDKVGIDIFFKLLYALGLLDCPLEMTSEISHNNKVYDKYLTIYKIFISYTLSYSDWLYIWMKTISEITLDDTKGGKVTVMGVWETRGVAFDGVVIVDFNEGVTPALPSKDQFLNSSVRVFAGLPTKNDKEALQKQLYKRVLEQAKQSVIIYSTSGNKLPSRFIYELGLGDSIEQHSADFGLLYDKGFEIKEDVDAMVPFDAAETRWSASKLKTYLTCKRKYYYRYIQHIKAKEEDEMNEGKFLHLLFQRVFSNKSFYDDKYELQKDISKYLDELLPSMDASVIYKKLLWQEKLKGFVDTQILHFKSGWRVTQKEIDIDGEIGGLRFNGRIDRIDQDNTHTFVLDYKTGKTNEANKEKNLEDLSDFQMSIYRQLLLKKYQNIKLAFVKIFENGKIEEARALEEKDELLFAHIAKMKNTKTLTASKCEDLKECEYCEFVLVCQRGEYL